MRARFLGVVLAVVLANGAFGKDVYLSIGGETGIFFTDARIFNPSFSKDIVISARYLQNNQDNSVVATVTVNVPKRTMRVLDNVVSAVFQSGGIGAIRLTSDDDFVATQRIYAKLDGPKTLGQFVPGLDVTSALKKGALIQLEETGQQGTIGTFRTNIGGVNPNAVDANVTFKLYDENDAVVKTKTFKFEEFGVLNPSGLAGFFEVSPNDLSDAWVSFDSDQPIFMYGSILDNGSDDPTFIPASADSGTVATVKTVTMVAQSNFTFAVTGGANLRAGDQVKFVLSSANGTHGYRLFAPNGQLLIDIAILPSTPTERTVTLPVQGNYAYLCTFSECGIGHFTMNGELLVE